MRVFFTWVLGLPVAIAAIVVAVANRQPVALELWPFPLIVEAPVYLVLLVPLAAGSIIGFVIAWLAQSRWRRLARQNRRRAESLEREVEILRRDAARKAAAEPTGDRLALPPKAANS